MDMMLNSLPSRTWNRLGINESFISINPTLTQHAPVLETKADNLDINLHAETPAKWATIETGIGPDSDKLLKAGEVITIHAGEKVVAEEPVLIRYNYTDDDCTAHRLFVEAEAESALTVIMLLQSDDMEDGGISAIQTKVDAAANAHVNIYVVQLLGDHMVCMNDVSGTVEEDATVELTKLELGSGKLYAGARFELVGKNSQFLADVGYLAREHQTMDMNYIANHWGKKSNSLMEVSGTLQENSRKVFRGSIDFKRGAKGATGTENENVLLLGEHIVNQTIPLILCQEEDVEGNHGASIGRLDEKVLFYLSTRGIAEEDAQRIIERARIDSICAKIPHEEAQEAVRAFQKRGE